ncbi:unnamed protein product [Phyllotreta striolata]|uniref:Uncharacterized protein n=1 Tax=Phyllotreta striolata TaxID=444603 RepID=A0A9N9TQR6_PHYSR|nr:unnamed protein product [Phyllotreta striolata]
MDHCKKVNRKKNPRETASLVSKLSFAYTTGLFRKGFKRDLEEQNVYDVIKPCKSKTCGDKLEKQWSIDSTKSKSIYRLLWNRFGWRYLFIGFVDLIFKISNSVLEPTCISSIVENMEEQTPAAQQQTYIWAAVLITSNFINTVYTHNCMLWTTQLGMEMRTAFSALLYRKALRLTPTAVSKINLGNIVTLITKDVQSFQLSIWMFNDMWNGTIQMFVCCYILYNKLGVSSLIGIGMILSVLPLQIFLSKLINKFRYETGKKTDERLQETQETLSTIKIIKMYTWEQFFSNKINKSRREEAKKILISFHLKMTQIVSGILFSKLGFYVFVMSYIGMGYNANTIYIFYAIDVFKDLEYNLGQLIPYGMGRAAELFSAIRRINQVISAEELPPKVGSEEATDQPILELKNASVHINDNLVLNNISFRANSGLILVTGKVGCGKSSFLKSLLQDYPLSAGSIMSRGRISYASQDPWLFPSSIKQNILFGEEFNEKRYLEVVRVCALEYDFKLLDKGDETIVCDRGLNLSKGQQARINLARAVYKESEMYLLDDSLTALDSQVQDYIFNECIRTFLASKLCLLVTQNVAQIKEADNVLVLDNGEIKSFGRVDSKVIEEISEAVNEVKETPHEKQIEQVEVDDDDDIDDVYSEETKLLEEVEQSNKKRVYAEVTKKGKVSFSIYKDYLMYGGGVCALFLNFLFFFSAQATESFSDYILASWTDKKEAIQNYQNSTLNQTIANQTTVNQTLLELEEQASLRLHLYSGSIFLLALLNLIRTYSVLELSRRASVNIHKVIIKKIINARMAFFDTHFLGNILNRFSNDFCNVDEQIPFVIFEVLRVLFELGGILFILVSLNGSFLIFAIILFFLLLVLRKYYLPTGRSLKRLEATTRSPMVGHLNASLEGLTTIRAYKMQTLLIDEFDRHQDLFTSAHYMWQCTTMAFGWAMDFCCAIFIACVVLSLVLLDSNYTAGQVGLAITQVIALSGEVEWGVRQWADLESLMTSVERLLEYAQIKTESPEGKELSDWPRDGAVTYENVSLSYNDSELVLKNLSFSIAPREKVGIVGRTGAGKSSIISSIFRLYEVEGNIFIDGMSIRVLSMKFLRKKLAIIPQDPVLFSGTIRTNLDPFEEYLDEDLWVALDKVGLKSIIYSLSQSVKSHASTFSSGQRQLLSVARAILRRSKIIILDEATANMDNDTDVMLNEIIRTNFSDCTVLTIAHRLETILGSDRVMVLDRGEIREFDAPRMLLKNEDGMFYKLVEQAGLLNYLNDK